MRYAAPALIVVAAAFLAGLGVPAAMAVPGAAARVAPAREPARHMPPGRSGARWPSYW